MASNLRIIYEATDDVTYSDVIDALGALDEDDISNSSPVTAGVPEAGVTVERVEVGRRVIVAVEGHDGEFTKKSTEAIVDAVADMDGVREVVTKAGGYEPAATTESDEAEDDADDDDEEE